MQSNLPPPPPLPSPRTPTVRSTVLQDADDGRLQDEPHASAPYIHPFNAPKYSAMQLRALQFGKSRSLTVLWMVAHDSAQASADTGDRDNVSEHQRRQWLRLHDQQTAGIMGLLPLVRGMPVRFTATVDKARGLFKNTRGTLQGWCLEDIDIERLRGDPGAAEMTLRWTPKCLFVKVTDATWTERPGLKPGVYPMEPVYRVWTRDKEQKAFSVPETPTAPRPPPLLSN
jgi:hypothetical protein